MGRWAIPGICEASSTAPPGVSGDHRDLSYRDADDQHPINAIVGLQDLLDLKASIVHQHAMTDVMGLAQALDGKANTLHSHNETDIVDLDKYTQAEVDALLSGKADVTHGHLVADITDIDTFYSQVGHGHDSAEIIYDNAVSGLGATDVKAALDELASIIDPGEVVQAVITDDAGDGLPAGDLNGTDFTGHPRAQGTSLEITVGDLYIFYHKSAAYLWSGPHAVTVGLGGSYIAVPADMVALSSADHNSLVNRDMIDQHPILAITGLQTELDGKSDLGHTHPISDVTNLQTELDNKADDIHQHIEADIVDLDKYSVAAVDTLLAGKLGIDHLTEIPNMHVPLGGIQGQVLIKNSNADRDVRWGYLEEILGSTGNSPPIFDGVIPDINGNVAVPITAYNASARFSSGGAVDTYTLQGAPSWMNIDLTSGFITGVPDAVATTTGVVVIATNGQGSASSNTFIVDIAA